MSLYHLAVVSLNKPFGLLRQPTRGIIPLYQMERDTRQSIKQAAYSAHGLFGVPDMLGASWQFDFVRAKRHSVCKVNAKN